MGMIGAVVRREHPAHDVLINLQAECMRDLLGDALIAESVVTKLHLDDGRDDFLRRALQAGLALGSRGREEAAIFCINQRLVES